MHTLKPKFLRSALYVWNPALLSKQDRLDTVHKARYVGRDASFCVQNLDEYTRHRYPLMYSSVCSIRQRNRIRIQTYLLTKISFSKTMTVSIETFSILPLLMVIALIIRISI